MAATQWSDPNWLKSRRVPNKAVVPAPNRLKSLLIFLTVQGLKGCHCAKKLIISWEGY
jgi:hypothetical protein